MKYPTYQINLPAEVRLDQTLSAHARLLYGEIKALCDQQGYCWASNQYLARLYGVQKETVSVWLRQLRRSGWIIIQVDVSQGNLRKIYLTQPANAATPSNEKSQREAGETTRALTSTSLPSYDTVCPKSPALLNRNIIDKNDRVDSTPLTILSIAEEDKNEGNKWGRDGISTPSKTRATTDTVSVENSTEVVSNQKPSSTMPSPPFRSPPLPIDKGKGKDMLSKPTVLEVTTYMQGQTELCSNASVAKAQASRFINYYQSNGWKVGRHPMQDWQAAARNWLLNTQQYETAQRSYAPKSFVNPIKENGERPMDYSIPL